MKLNNKVTSGCYGTILLLIMCFNCLSRASSHFLVVYLQLWHSFDDATGIISNDHSGAEPLSNELTNVVDVTNNPFSCPISSKVAFFPVKFCMWFINNTAS